MIGCSFLLLGIAGKGLVNPRPRLKCNDWEVSSDVFKAHETRLVFSKRDFEYAIWALKSSFVMILVLLMVFQLESHSLQYNFHSISNLISNFNAFNFDFNCPILHSQSLNLIPFILVYCIFFSVHFHLQSNPHLIYLLLRNPFIDLLRLLWAAPRAQLIGGLFWMRNAITFTRIKTAFNNIHFQLNPKKGIPYNKLAFTTILEGFCMQGPRRTDIQRIIRDQV